MLKDAKITIKGEHKTSRDPGEFADILEQQLAVPNSNGIGFLKEEIPLLIEALRLLARVNAANKKFKYTDEYEV